MDARQVNGLSFLNLVSSPNTSFLDRSTSQGKSFSTCSSTTEGSPAKRHCVAAAGSSNSIPMETVDGEEPINFQDPCVEAVDENGQPDLSTWKGMLTQTKAAQSKTARSLLKKSRELRNLVMDDPPTKSGCLVYSYARGKRGYMTSDRPVSNGVPTEEARMVEIDVWKRVYTLEVELLNESRRCVLEGGHYEMMMTLANDRSREDTSATSGPLPTLNGCTLDSIVSGSGRVVCGAARGKLKPSVNGATWETLGCLENVSTIVEEGRSRMVLGGGGGGVEEMMECGGGVG